MSPDTPFSSRQRFTSFYLQTQLQERKRKVYVATLCIGLLSVILVWLNYKEERLFIRNFYPVLMGILVVCIAALAWKRIPLHWVEYSLQTLLSLFYLSNYVFILQFPDTLSARTELEAVFWAMAFLIVIGYAIMVNHTIALWLAFGYIFLALLLGSILLLPEHYLLFLETLRLEIRLLMMAMITFVLAKAKDDMITVQSELLRMDALANTDFLTGLPNRRMLSIMIEEHLRLHLPIALLLIDIDHFKSINDTHGHEIGDTALIRVAHTLRLHLREGDMVSRWGGEEFLALICTNQQMEIMAIAECMRCGVENLQFDSFSLTISIGATVVREHEAIEIALKRVDHALYEAKANGRNCICWQG